MSSKSSRLSFYLTLGRSSTKGATYPIMNSKSFSELNEKMPTKNEFISFIKELTKWHDEKTSAEKDGVVFSKPSPIIEISLENNDWVTFCKEVKRKTSAKFPSDLITEVFLLGGDSRFMIGRIVKKQA